MGFFGKHWKQFKSFAALPEMQIFWIFLPFLLVIFGINAFFLPSSLSPIASGLLIGVAVFIFLSAYRAARINFDAKLERNELKNIVLSLEDALIVYDKNFRILFFNAAAEKLFGVRAEAVLGKEIHPQDAEKSSQRLLAMAMFPSLAPTVIARSKAGETPQVTDVSLADPALELRIATSPVVDEKGNLLGFMKIIRDRTREISLIKSKNEFITTASHQLRTPINEINWALESLGNDPALNEESKALIKNTLRSAKLLIDIIDNLLSVSKIEEGRFGYNFESVDIVEFLGGVLGAALPQVQRAGLKLYFERPPEPLPHVTIDSQKLLIVISNLLDNAVRYNVENGQIVVRARKSDKGPFLEVSVKDTGIGIPVDELDKLFGKFFRASNALKFKTEGSGLGIYIARSIVQAHGGQMWVESELNRGTTFFFTLPTDPTLVPPKEVPMEY